MKIRVRKADYYTLKWMMLKVKRRSHFQLLEIMIAIFLLTLCALPILEVYVHMNRVELAEWRAYQRDHLAGLIHARIVENLYRRAIPWHDLVGGKPEKLEKLSGSEDLLNQLKKISYEGSYQLSIEKPKPDDLEKAKKFLLKLKISLQDTTKKQESIGKKHLHETSVDYNYDIYGER